MTTDYMINFSLLTSNSESAGPGGLFDIDATLPLVMVQFLFLMFILNTIFYTPLLTIIDERKQYILTNLGQASDLLAEANLLTNQYEEEIKVARTDAQLEIINSQQIHKNILEFELNSSQDSIDSLLTTIMKDLSTKKDIALNNLDNVVKSLSNNIEKQLLI